MILLSSWITVQHIAKLKLIESTRNHYDNGYSQYQAQVSGKTTDKTEQVYSILLQTFKTDNFAIIVGAWKLLTIVAKSSILNVLG